METVEAKYLKDPTKCPFCGSREITESSRLFQRDPKQAWQKISCKKCGQTWNDEWVLVGISGIHN